MILLFFFAFLGGIVTILSPCILPILPVVLTGSIGSGKRRPLGIISGFILSFTFFTLFLASIVRITNIPADSLRLVSIVIIFLFGISLLLPQFQKLTEQLFSKLSNKFTLRGNHEGFSGGLVVGLSLGLVWTPCVGPILASVITLAATSTVNLMTVVITLSYALGTAIPMFIIMYGGRGLLKKIPWLLPNTEKIQKFFGILMILTAISIFFNIDRQFQSYVLDTFPQYGVGLTQFEDSEAIRNQLQNLNRKSQSPDVLGNAPEFIPGGEWFNTAPLTLQQLRGKVVLVDFWTYTCINCIRTLPYLKSWHEKYEAQGLVIVGVHTPEFVFERDEQNVRQAIEDFGIKYPVMQDNEYATWNAYQNRYWPAKYLIDAEGRVRYTHFGEGAYDKTEQTIQELLKELGSIVNTSVESAPDQNFPREQTPEIYLGSQRMEYYFPDGHTRNGTTNFTLERVIPQNFFSFGGTWTITDEYALSGKGAILDLHFAAKKVFLVMKPGTNGAKKVSVLLDGGPLTDNSGQDVENGKVMVDANRLYELVDLQEFGNHRLRLEFDPGVEVYAFTFGW
jgi:cytochrome c biogenesis protein CcdA/thiol-disulfide isomerase/thioredoxin